MILLRLKTFKLSEDQTLYFDDIFPKNFEIDFHMGLNVILGEKTEDNESINDLGKSAIIEFINYGLGSNHEPNTLFCYSSDIFTKYVISLTFLHDTKQYTIYRQIGGTSIFLNKGEWEGVLKSSSTQAIYLPDGTELHSITLDAYKKHLRTICYGSNTYDLSFRDLIRSNLRVRDRKHMIHTLGYIPLTSTQKKATLINLLLLGFDNELLKILHEDITIREKNIKTVLEFHHIPTGKGIGKIKETEKKIRAKKDELTKIQSELQNFKETINKTLGVDITETLEQLKDIRSAISQYYIKIGQNTKLAESYQEQLSQLKMSDKIDNEFISSVFNDINLSFNTEIESSLEEIQIFFKDLYSNRQIIIEQKIKSLSEEKEGLTSKRQELFKQKNYLETQLEENGQKSILQSILDKQHILSAQQGQLEREIRDLESVLQMCKTEKQLEPEIEKAQKKYNKRFKELSDSYNNMFTSIYGKEDFNPEISFSHGKEIKIFDTFSIGQGAGYTAMAYMIYDIWRTTHNKSGIKFLIHDDYFFNGINDPEKLSKYINLTKELIGKDYQYITILSETEISESLKQEIINNKLAVISLSEQSLLFGKRF